MSAGLLVMGYPMTFRRLINRNGLGTGGYDDAGQWKISVNTDNPGLASVDEFQRYQFPHLVEALRRQEGRITMLLGDLRRLEADAVDESAICLAIAHRTGIDKDAVALVLKEFIAY